MSSASEQRESMPPAPRQLKRIGHAESAATGGWMVYTEEQLLAYGRACFAAGVGVARGKRAAPASASGGVEPSAEWQREDDRWADWRAGRGPYPRR